MLAFWPNDAEYSHLIFCIEGGREVIGDLDSGIDKYNPSVQRIDVATGEVETILRGMTACDGIRRTAWGTILATEETDDGGAYEILLPLETTNYTIADRASGAIIDANGDADGDEIAKRPALPVIAWEGLWISPEGVVIAGDEERPGSSDPGTGTADDADGGAIFKFIPAVTHTGGATITDLDDSPLYSGSTYALQVSCVNNKQQVGQGCEIGNAAWVSVSAGNARADANNNGATGYYRPEDLHEDPTYAGPGVRICWTNTGNEGAENYAEVVCGIDGDYLNAHVNSRSVTVNRFVEGDSDFNSFDNLDFQPHTGILYVIEDHDNGDIFACLPDGADRDIKTDGCVRIASVKSLGAGDDAEPTGFTFDASGTIAYVAIQHSGDDNCVAASDCAAVDDYPTDDIVRISGFKLHNHMIK
jgi:secreted PhoX family phosphatase